MEEFLTPDIFLHRFAEILRICSRLFGDGLSPALGMLEAVEQEQKQVHLLSRITGLLDPLSLNWWTAWTDYTPLGRGAVLVLRVVPKDPRSHMGGKFLWNCTYVYLKFYTSSLIYFILFGFYYVLVYKYYIYVIAIFSNHWSSVIFLLVLGKYIKNPAFEFALGSKIVFNVSKLSQYSIFYSLSIPIFLYSDTPII